jgi:hypothetical protein
MLPRLLVGLAELAIMPEDLRVCIYLDGCTDGSADLLSQAVSTLPFQLMVEIGPKQRPANAGAARRRAMELGLRALGGAEGLLFTTDADTVPHPDWVSAGREALAVADVVAGEILRADAAADPEQTRVERYYDRLYRLRRSIDPVVWEAPDTHHFSGGANLAMRASAYRAIGGFRPLPCGEDATLLDDAARAGFRVRRDAKLRVETSSRRSGRVTGGLAGSLRAIDAGRQIRVSDPRAGAWQWREQAMARRSFAMIDQMSVRVAVGERLGLSADHVLGVARDCPNAEAFAMRIVPAAPVFHDAVTLGEAEDLLAMLDGGTCGIAA